MRNTEIPLYDAGAVSEAAQQTQSHEKERILEKGQESHRVPDGVCSPHRLAKLSNPPSSFCRSVNFDG